MYHHDDAGGFKLQLGFRTTTGATKKISHPISTLQASESECVTSVYVFGLTFFDMLHVTFVMGSIWGEGLGKKNELDYCYCWSAQGESGEEFLT